jgi:hypothetical protein
MVNNMKGMKPAYIDHNSTRKNGHPYFGNTKVGYFATYDMARLAIKDETQIEIWRKHNL